MVTWMMTWITHFAGFLRGASLGVPGVSRHDTYQHGLFFSCFLTCHETKPQARLGIGLRHGSKALKALRRCSAVPSAMR